MRTPKFLQVFHNDINVFRLPTVKYLQKDDFLILRHSFLGDNHTNSFPENSSVEYEPTEENLIEFAKKDIETLFLFPENEQRIYVYLHDICQVDILDNRIWCTSKWEEGTNIKKSMGYFDIDEMKFIPIGERK